MSGICKFFTSSELEEINPNKEFIQCVLGLYSNSIINLNLNNLSFNNKAVIALSSGIRVSNKLTTLELNNCEL